MTGLAKFQKRTVEVALERFNGKGPRRFLVADEVGLGKTIIARSVAEGLRKERRRLNVLYLCPSLEIVGQNRSKFVSLTGIAEQDYATGEDRLTLVPGALPDEGNGYRIFTFTPETSLPGWKPGPRTGRKAERALIRTLLERYDALRPIVLRMDREHGKATRCLLDECAAGLEGYTFAAIERALRDVFDCPTGSVEKAVVAWVQRADVNIGEFIGRFRAVLALTALRLPAVRPDLVVLDEFHRYADLILPKPVETRDPLRVERARVHRLLVDALLGGEKPPAVLLLSATPYRLRRLSGEEMHPVEHYRALVDLAGFLADDASCRDQVETAMRDYHDALRTPGSPQDVRSAVTDAKTRLEALLMPLMARTERALVHKEDLFEREMPKVEVEAADLKLFKHLAQICGSQFAGWAPQMWSSIPYPAQTLHGYAVWKSICAAKAPPFEAGSGRGRLAHPQLRSLVGITGGALQLNLPWQPPTVGWWRLEGPWSSGKPLPGKTLLFSRWRGAPTSISALLSIDLMGGIKLPGTKATPPLLRPGGTESGALVALFMPWPTLAHAIEPLKEASRTIVAVKRDAERQLQSFLERHGVSFTGKEKRPTWIVACGIERQISRPGFNRIAAIALSARGSSKSRDWKSIEPVSTISRSELAALASHLLSAPGSIIARCARRHDVPQEEKGEVAQAFDIGWNRLRGYLGHRAFVELILQSSRRTRYPDAMCDAILKGGFEAVLDEQMTLLGQLGDASGLDILEQLSNCLLDRPSLVQFRRGKNSKLRIPAQAVTPFAGRDQGKAGKKSGRLRSDTLRRAFNSPFWPHVLCTTSVGQEGLDFHQWCRRIVHWDLPGDPVDFEQRDEREHVNRWEFGAF
ncbi:DEAD/DEAH box helicase family protein [Paraburkholderia phytofirmans]|uniref:DEAD-like helicase n=1 Tax=Paraburkholderia phytofirmans (strain DSM 17436 / LMG 22146 / PsJN) TaxID=398527 RepID=B2T8W1_PARPJ|nr:DEAD/DEAH box helicase family protein [Paraburkholderia phytofirmans]ACD20774.1 DEAD-like helicase [Paraburkholderia phytofirmans PsJN]